MLNLVPEEVSAVISSSIEKNVSPQETKVMSRVLELSTEYPKGLGLSGTEENFLLVSPHVGVDGKSVLATETGIYIIKQQKLEAGAGNNDRMVNVISGAVEATKKLVSAIPTDDFETKFPPKVNGLFVESITQVNLDDPDSDTHQEMVGLIKEMSRFRASADARRNDNQTEESVRTTSPVEALAKVFIDTYEDRDDVAVNNYSWVASTDRWHPGLFEIFGDHNKQLTNAIKTIDADQDGNRLWIVGGVMAVVNYPDEISKSGDAGLNLYQALNEARRSSDKRYEGDMNGRKLVINICQVEQPDRVPEKLIESLLSSRSES
ncbi:hypothetical protein HYV64_01840 [Candidatus Shapirobacteria bacterium]|nr:hypothetical protein [Candidatus Shapirobacteria bacterium]